jgi:hypothetical protein
MSHEDRVLTQPMLNIDLVLLVPGAGGYYGETALAFRLGPLLPEVKVCFTMSTAKKQQQRPSGACGELRGNERPVDKKA